MKNITNETSKETILDLFSGFHLKVGHSLFQTIDHVFQVFLVVKLEANLTRISFD